MHANWHGFRAGALAATLALGCSGDDGNQVPVTTTSPSTSGPTTMTGPTGSATDTDTDTGGTGNCGGVVCQGHGKCEMDNMGNAGCVCDDGYLLNEDGDTCIVDETCIELRLLEERCRQIYNGAPAVATFFAVDFCSGTAVLPEKLEELGLAFKVLENGVDIAENVESFASVIDKDVESYVSLVLDISDSVTNNDDLPQLVAELRGFVSSLQPEANEPDVHVSVIVFGRHVAHYVEWTSDLGLVDSALATIETDPGSVQALVGGMGTALYEATQEGIEETQRIRELRDAVTGGTGPGGVLTTGTIVVVTDGKDTSNGSLNSGLITQTLNQIVSVGISLDIDDTDLTTIGRDGSFLAPTPADWTQAFSEIAERVDQYPDRAYLLAYCSSATMGSPLVEVSLSGRIVPMHITGCMFSAELFSSDPNDVCTLETFTSECDGQDCGGLTACGSCANNQCCNFGSCFSPGTAGDCQDQDALCAQDGEVCIKQPDPNLPDYCGPPSVGMVPCDDDLIADCEPTVQWCYKDEMMANDPGECRDTLPLGAVCTTPKECASQNCTQINPDNPFEDTICRPSSHIFDVCGDDKAICETGSYCQGSTCDPRKLNTVSCGNSSQCRSGRCDEFAMGSGNVCLGGEACYWSWDEKVPN